MPPRPNQVTPQRRVPPPVENRDPNNVNPHIKIKFDDVIGEPYSARSLDCCWMLIPTVYDCFRDLVYNVLTIMCSMCIALAWGIEFAAVAFQHVWCLTPSSKCIKLLCMDVFGRCFTVIFRCTIEPVVYACGGLFVNCQTEGVDYEKIKERPFVVREKKPTVSKRPAAKPEVVKEKETEALEEPTIFLGDKSKMSKTIGRQLKQFM